MIGEFTLTMSSITQLYAYPQYFDVVDSNQQLVGKILARFYLKSREYNLAEKEAKEIREQLMHIVSEKQRSSFNVSVSVVGLRKMLH